MKPVRVLDLRDTYEIGGPGKTILETYRFIDAARFELHLGVFMAPTDSVETPFLQAARNYGMPVHLLHGSNRYDPRLISRTAALVRALDIDIVHAHEVKSDVIAWLATKLNRVPIVTTMHGWIGNSLRQRAFIALDKLVARRFDMVLAVSGRIRNELIEAGVPTDRVRLVHNAIVVDRYRRTGKQGFVARLVGRQLAPPLLVCIGRLSAEKGHADMIQAMGALAKQGIRVSAVIAGDGPERTRLEQLTTELGLADSVCFPGYIDVPQRLLEDADLMVLPSHTEGLPNAALEALAMDVPVLATNVGGTPEVIEHGVTGWLVAPRDPDAIALAISEFLTRREEWRRMAARGKAAVERQFDFQARTRLIETLYLEVAGASRA